MKTLLAVISLGLLLMGCGKKEPVQPSASDLTTPPPFAETKVKAEAGDAGAQTYLGFMYERGLGVDQNYVTAYAWASIAATNGDKNAPRFKSEFLEPKMIPA